MSFEGDVRFPLCFMTQASISSLLFSFFFQVFENNTYAGGGDAQSQGCSSGFLISGALFLGFGHLFLLFLYFSFVWQYQGFPCVGIQ